MKRAAPLGCSLTVFALAIAIVGIGCATLAKIPPATPPTPGPVTPPAAAEHLPQCDGPAGFVSECWQRPPGSPWVFNCKGGAPTVASPADCPAAPPVVEPPIVEPPAEGTCHEWIGQRPESQKGHFEDDVNLAIDAACAKAGVTCGEDGPKRPGAWDDFVADVADPLVAKGYVVTYDYLHGEEGGRASEMSVKRGNRVENFQLESSEARVRRPPGGYRSYCEPASGEGQPIRPRKPTTTPTPKPIPPTTPGADPSRCDAGTPDATSFELSISWNSNRTIAWVGATPKVKASERGVPDFCRTYFTDSRQWGTCGLRPEGHPQAADCAWKHGLPKWSIDGEPALECVDPNINCPGDSWKTVGDDFHVHAAAGRTVKACLAWDPSACSDPVTVR